MIPNNPKGAYRLPWGVMVRPLSFGKEAIMTKAKAARISRNVKRLIAAWTECPPPKVDAETMKQALTSAMILVRNLDEEGGKISHRKAKEMLARASLTEFFGAQWHDEQLIEAVEKAF